MALSIVFALVGGFVKERWPVMGLVGYEDVSGLGVRVFGIDIEDVSALLAYSVLLNAHNHSLLIVGLPTETIHPSILHNNQNRQVLPLNHDRSHPHAAEERDSHPTS